MTEGPLVHDAVGRHHPLDRCNHEDLPIFLFHAQCARLTSDLEWWGANMCFRVRLWARCYFMMHRLASLAAYMVCGLDAEGLIRLAVPRLTGRGRESHHRRPGNSIRANVSGRGPGFWPGLGRYEPAPAPPTAFLSSPQASRFLFPLRSNRTAACLASSRRRLTRSAAPARASSSARVRTMASPHLRFPLWPRRTVAQ